MKNIKTLIIVSLLISQIANAIELGSLDTSFSNDGTTDGYDITGAGNFHSYASATVVDSQGRIYVAGTFDTEVNGVPRKRARVERRLPNGDFDTSFGVNGTTVLGLPPAASGQFEYSLVLDASDVVFLGYSILRCDANNDCQSDVRIDRISESGGAFGGQTVSFDFGSSFERQDDDFADMIYIPSINKIAIAAEVERTGANDIDFGIALLNVDSVTGNLSLDTAFSTDGISSCFFDQQNSSGSEDITKAITWDPLQNNIVVGGSVFEGNGVGGDGYNFGFCEFDLSGNTVNKWSTQSPDLVADSREFLVDIAFVNQSGFSTIVATGQVPGDGGFDFALTRFDRDIFGNWNQDTTFGSNGTGWETTNFQFIFVGDTEDSPAEMIIESDGNILVAGTAKWGGDTTIPQGAIAMAKYTANGILNTNWGIGKSGKAVNPLEINAPYFLTVLGIASDPKTEEIYAVGFLYDGLYFDNFIANMHNDSIFSNNFDF